MIKSKDCKRKVITFCGSSRFRELFHKLASEYTLMGWVVLMPHCYYEHDSRPDLKDLLVEIHRDMITMSDAVLIVNKDGSLSDLQVVQPLEPACDQEVLRVLKTMPQWKPGVMNAKPCRTMVCIPVVFNF